jgi:hypothetical protein
MLPHSTHSSKAEMFGFACPTASPVLEATSTNISRISLGDPPEIVSGMVAVDFRNADVTRFVASFFIAAAAATSNNIARFAR